MSGASGGRAARLDPDESLVELRCSVIVSRDDRLLLIGRDDRPEDWVLPGGRAQTAAYLGTLWRPLVGGAFTEAGGSPADPDVIWPS